MKQFALMGLMAAPLAVVILGGCFASAGPTIGYRTGDGLTIGAEVTSGYLYYIHGGAGFFMRGAREKQKDDSMVATFYGFLGPGVYWPVSSSDFLSETALGIGVVGDRETDASLFLRLWGGPSYVYKGGIVFNCFLGASFWDKGVWLHLTPQVGLFAVPGLGNVE